MSLVASLNVGVSALKTYSQGIQVISNNIANVSTTGYKASRAAYSDQFSNLLRPLVPNQANGTKVPPTQIGGGVQVQGINAVFSQGTVQSSGNVSDLAITGAGFFRVRDIDGGKDYVTRAGNFRVSTDGTLATQDGYQVQGTFGAQTRVIYDAASGRFNVMGPQDNITRVNVTSGGGVTITKASQYSFDITPTSEVQNLKVGMTAFAADVDGTSTAYGRISKVEGNRVTVSGYDGQPSSGGVAPTSLAFNAVKGTVVDGDTSSTPNTDYYNFELFDSTTVESLKIGQAVNSEYSASLNGIITAIERSSTSTKVIVKKEVAGAWSWDADGDPNTANVSNFRGTLCPIGEQLFSLDGGYRESGQVGSVDVGFSATGGRVQVVDTQGVEVNDVTVLAKVPGMKSFNVGPSGDIIVNLSNGQTFISGRVLIQNFKDPNSLIRQGNNLFSGIDNAGPINGTDLSLIGNTAGEDGLGLIQSSSLEMSNVDLGQEFAEMITTQRSFQAGSRVISVSDQMLEEVVNLKR